MLAMQMTAPPPEQLHATLARCFAARMTPEQLAALVDDLAAELHRPATSDRAPLSRAVVSLALWKLAEHQLASAARPPATLTALLPAVFGCSLDELACLRGMRTHPWQVLARDYGILDYAVRADAEWCELALVVDCRLNDMPDVFDAQRWATCAALFWGDVRRTRSDADRVELTATLRLPTSSRGTAVPVQVTVARGATPFQRHAEVTVTSLDRQTSLDCVAHLTAETPRGGAWTTRVTQRKALRSGGPMSGLLPYWTQAETLCLALAV
ncbi:MAG: hypothetical protein SF182_22000 [Deltaproteobacteria bacterium]|nr:hypothetical protein [Deltaproteobacteria bacterium]